MKRITGMYAKDPDGWFRCMNMKKREGFNKLFLNETVGREGEWMEGEISKLQA